jgi:hypothetical protein
MGTRYTRMGPKNRHMEDGETEDLMGRHIQVVAGRQLSRKAKTQS